METRREPGHGRLGAAQWEPPSSLQVPVLDGLPVICQRPEARPRNPRCPGIGVYFPDPGQIGIGAKSRVLSRSRPNRDRENPGYFPGRIGARRGGIRGFRGLQAEASKPQHCGPGPVPGATLVKRGRRLPPTRSIPGSDSVSRAADHDRRRFTLRGPKSGAGVQTGAGGLQTDPRLPKPERTARDSRGSDSDPNLTWAPASAESRSGEF
jgi:hypothetical protein